MGVRDTAGSTFANIIEDVAVDLSVGVISRPLCLSSRFFVVSPWPFSTDNLYPGPDSLFECRSCGLRTHLVSRCFCPIHLGFNSGQSRSEHCQRGKA
jgi:hypothetical protein